MERIFLLCFVCAVGWCPQGVQCHGRKFWDELENKLDLPHPSVILNGAEVTGFLRKAVPNRLYFAAEVDNTPVTVRVMPCDAALQWNLTLLELPVQIIGQGSCNFETLGLWMKLFDETDAPGLDVFSHRGNEVESFYTENSPAGLYKLELLSTEKDTVFKVYASVTNEPAVPYPDLPDDPRIQVTSVGHASVSLAWEPISEASQDRHGTGYCVFRNQEHNYKTLCAVESKLRESEAFKPTSWDLPVQELVKAVATDQVVGRKNALGQSFGNIGSTEPTLFHKKGLQMVCIGDQTNFTFDSLKPGTLYYFDVFAVNSLTQRSSAYTGAFTETIRRSRSKILELKDGVLTEVFVKRKGIRLLSFDPAFSQGQITVAIHSCLQKVKLQILQNGKIATSERIEGVRHFQVSNNTGDKHLIILKGGKKGPGLLKIYATTRPHEQPFPSVPRGTSLKVFDKLTTCSSVTVAWMGTKKRNKYCLYLKPLEETLDLQLTRWHQNSCLGPGNRLKKEKVICKHLHGQNIHSSIIAERVEGLEPGKMYLLDVYVTGQTKHTFKYPGRIVRTRLSC
uniref:Protein NDNF n=1 Tax=Latimeria chalumnae TaxID=7897 RepID=H3BBP8_LATCH